MGALIAAAGVTLIKELAVLEAPGVFRFAFGTSLLPRVNEISVDVRLFAIVFAITATTSLAVGLLPAFRLSQPASLEALGSRGGGVARSDSRLRAGLVVTQLALATMLLVGAGLLTRSFVNLSAVDRGYEASGVLAFQAVFPPDYATARRAEVIESILARLRALPAIESAGFTRANVLIPEEIFVGTFVPKGRTSQEMLLDPKRPRVRPVSRGYLSTMAATMIDGRELNERDSQASRPAIVISRTVAHTFFGTERAVGQVVDWHVSQNVAVEAEVVGVVEDIRNGAPDGDANAEVFVDYQQLLPLLQRSGVAGPRLDMTAMGVLSFVIRARGEPSAAAPLVREVVRSVDPNTGIDSMVPLDRLVANSVARQRFNMVLLGVFAGVAALLAAIGVYGVLVYAVAQRSREIGIRMALGAARRQVLGLVLRQGSRLTLAGLAFGLLGAAIGARLVDSLLFGITPLDPTTFVAVAVAFALVATLASYVPARRATSVDPMVALRTE
jgi:putative ABC transport system permease protein